MSMSTAVADASAGAAPKGKKKLIIIVAAVLALVAGGGGAVVVMKKKAAAAAAAAEEEDGDDAGAAAPEKHAKDEHKTVPTFVPLEVFVVNLADKDAERFAQIGVTLEVDDPKFAEQLKVYMPAIRSGILMVMSHKTSQQLLDGNGKIQLAKDVMREAVLPLGIEVDADDADDDASKGKKGKKKRKAAVHNPVTHVHYSTFIIQ
jgi:flagellar protein FliL